MKIDRDEMAKPINPIRSSQIFQYVPCTYVIEPIGDLSLGFAFSKEAIAIVIQRRPQIFEEISWFVLMLIYTFLSRIFFLFLFFVAFSKNLNYMNSSNI